MALNLKLPENVKVESEQATVSGGKFSLDTGVYLVKIVQAYFTNSSGGATAMNFLFKTSEGKELNQTIYISNRQGGITYIVKKGNDKGKELPLPGYSLVDYICKSATGKSLEEIAVNTKPVTISVRNFNTKQNENKSFDMFTDLLDTKLHLAVEERKVNKQVDNGNGYEDTNEFKLVNEIITSYTEAGLHSTEIESGITVPAHIVEWRKIKTGKLVDKFKPVTGGVTTGVPKQTSASAF